MADEEISSLITANENPSFSPLFDIPTPPLINNPVTKLEKTFSFVIDLEATDSVKKALEALMDIEFNPSRVSHVRVNEDGFDITVTNVDSGVVGNLYLRASSLSHFNYFSEFEMQCSNLLESLVDVICDKEFPSEESFKDSITMFQFSHKPRSIYLEFGKRGKIVYKVELEEVEGIFDKPLGDDVRIDCSVLIPIEILQDMIDNMVTSGGLVFKVAVSKDLLSIARASGQQELDTWTEGVLPGEKYTTEFNFPHTSLLTKATNIGKWFHLGIARRPTSLVGICFNLSTIGRTIYFRQPAFVNKEACFIEA